MILVIHITMVISIELIRVVEYVAMTIVTEMYLNLVETMVVLTVNAIVNIIYALMEISVIVFQEEHANKLIPELIDLRNLDKDSVR